MLMGSINLEMWIDHRYLWGIDSLKRYMMFYFKIDDTEHRFWNFAEAAASAQSYGISKIRHDNGDEYHI